jgi:hypothetical protein
MTTYFRDPYKYYREVHNFSEDDIAAMRERELAAKRKPLDLSSIPDHVLPAHRIRDLEAEVAMLRKMLNKTHTR